MSERVAHHHRGRPRDLSLLRLRFPVGAVCSFAHRVSGALLAAFAAALAVLLRRSLEDPAGYQWAARLVDSVSAKAAMALLLWAFAHHVLAGARHLLMDVDVGSSLEAARRSARSVNVLAIVLAALAFGALW